MMTIDQLEYGIANYGTPLYVFDLDEIRKTAAGFRRQADGRAKICYAMKANPFLTKQMSELTDRIEVCSIGEYEICRELRIPPEKMLISGVLKERSDLERIIADLHDACVFSVESVNQFCYIADWCKLHREPLRVYLRLTSGNQFGMDEQTIKELISVRKTWPFLRIEGLHFFSGTQKRRSETIRKELLRIDRLLREIQQTYGLEALDLEYGPGIEMPYFEGQPDKREQGFGTLFQTAREMTWGGRLILEMGRQLVGTAGYYLTGVRDLKTNEGKNYCIVDGGIHQVNYDGQIKGMYRPFLQISPERRTDTWKEWTICGSLCTNNDILVANVKLQDLKVNDVLIFQRTGAYAMTEGMALFLSHALPKAAVFSREKGWRLIRPEQPTFLWNTERMAEDGDLNTDFRGNQQ